jgi:hypothetical protein
MLALDGIGPDRGRAASRSRPEFLKTLLFKRHGKPLVFYGLFVRRARPLRENTGAGGPSPEWGKDWAPTVLASIAEALTQIASGETPVRQSAG